MFGTSAQQRLSTLSTHLCGASDGPSSAATASTAAESLPPPAAPHVEPVVVTLRDSHRDAMLPGVGPSTRKVTIRQLVPSDEAAYCAFGGRVTWREGWHYPLFGLPGTDEHFRQVRLAQGVWPGLPGWGAAHAIVAGWKSVARDGLSTACLCMLCDEPVLTSSCVAFVQ